MKSTWKEAKYVKVLSLKNNVFLVTKSMFWSECTFCYISTIFFWCQYRSAFIFSFPCAPKARPKTPAIRITLVHAPCWANYQVLREHLSLWLINGSRLSSYKLFQRLCNVMVSNLESCFSICVFFFIPRSQGGVATPDMCWPLELSHLLSQMLLEDLHSYPGKFGLWLLISLNKHHNDNFLFQI